MMVMLPAEELVFAIVRNFNGGENEPPSLDEIATIADAFIEAAKKERDHKPAVPSAD